MSHILIAKSNRLKLLYNQACKDMTDTKPNAIYNHLYTVAETSRLLTIPKSTLYDYIRQRRIKSITRANKLYIKGSDILSFWNKQKIF